jgi:hypothetical protein
LVLGDSASAHFHVPPAYLNASAINNHTCRSHLVVLAIPILRAEGPLFEVSCEIDACWEDFPSMDVAIVTWMLQPVSCALTSQTLRDVLKNL